MRALAMYRKPTVRPLKERCCPLPSDTTQHRVPVSASLIIQLLVAAGCLPGAVILPRWYAEFRGITQVLLFVVGGVAAVSALVTILFGQRISRTMARLGMRSRVVIPREGLVYLAIMLLLAVGGLAGHSDMLLLVFGLMAGPWIINGALVSLALRGVSVERRTAGRVTAGQTMPVHLIVRNSKSLLSSWMLDVRDDITEADNRSQTAAGAGIVTFARLPPRSSRTGVYEAVFHQRGRYRLGPLRVSSRFPLGIGERAQILPDFAAVLVRPRLVTLKETSVRDLYDQVESPVRKSLSRGLFDDDFHRIRDFRSGDSPRSIHWRSTARRGRLMVQEFQQNRESDLFVILDLKSLPNVGLEDLELAVSFVASLCVRRVHSGAAGRSTLAVTGAVPGFVSDTRASRFAAEALDVLAVCGPSPSASLEEALDRTADSGAMTQAHGIIVSTRPEFCRLQIPEFCSGRRPDSSDFSRRIAVLPATRDALMPFIRSADLPRGPAGADTVRAESGV